MSDGLFGSVQDVFTGRNNPKYRRHNFAFAGLLTCAFDGCTVTTELQKGKYIYQCSHGRGECSLPYMREEYISDGLGEVLKNIYVPENIAGTIVDSLHTNSAQAESER